jgi:hypothetical protein
MLENYFITQGREWERYAWIKARVMTGHPQRRAGAIARPFVFRKYLDFGAINAMRDLHAQIRREVARKDMANNVKLGPGGIREIEFIAQVFQLIRGGRDTALQIKPTAQGARAAGRARHHHPRGRARTGRRLRLPAPRRTPPAIPRRRPDPQPARKDADQAIIARGHGLCLLRRPCSPNSTTTARSSAGTSTASSATPPRPATASTPPCGLRRRRGARAEEFRRLGYRPGRRRPPPRRDAAQRRRYQQMPPASKSASTR